MQSLCNSVLSVNSVTRGQEPNFFRLFRFFNIWNRTRNRIFRFRLFRFRFRFFRFGSSVSVKFAHPYSSQLHSSSSPSSCTTRRARGFVQATLSSGATLEAAGGGPPLMPLEAAVAIFLHLFSVTEDWSRIRVNQRHDHIAEQQSAPLLQREPTLGGC